MTSKGDGRGQGQLRTGPALLDQFILCPDADSRHEITIDAPPGLVLEVARNLDMQSIGMVRAIVRLRAWMLGARGSQAWRRGGLVAEMLAMGWGRLAEEPDRYFVAGAICQPWRGDVVFHPIPAHQFATFSAPDRVKIAWTLEAVPMGSGRTRFATETRAVATDEVARARFRRYWRTFGIGIVGIRWLILPALRREAERRWREARAGARGSEPRPGSELTLTPREIRHER